MPRPPLRRFLLGGAGHNVFNTQVIELRDEGRLISAGILDFGARTLAGILNFYDPGYHRHSLGKYLLLLKTDYARRLQLDYYYPGYLVHNYPKFDYKLFACAAATEVFDSISGKWAPFDWEAVRANSAELFAEWLPEDLRGMEVAG